MKEKKTANLELKKQFNSLKNQNQSLAKTIDEISNRDSDFANEETKELKLQNSQLQNSLNEMIAKVEETQRQDGLISAKNSALMNSIEVLETENTQLREQKVAQKNVDSKVNNLSQKLEKLTIQNGEKNDEITQLTEERNQMSERAEKNAQTISLLENELAKSRNVEKKDDRAEIQALQQTKRQLERDSRENILLIETLQREKFETLELYNSAQKALKSLQKSQFSQQQQAEHREHQLETLGVVSSGFQFGIALWRGVNQCLHPLTQIPTVQRVIHMIQPKMKVDDLDPLAQAQAEQPPGL